MVDRHDPVRKISPDPAPVFGPPSAKVKSPESDTELKGGTWTPAFAEDGLDKFGLPAYDGVVWGTEGCKARPPGTGGVSRVRHGGEDRSVPETVGVIPEPVAASEISGDWPD